MSGADCPCIELVDLMAGPLAATGGIEEPRAKWLLRELRTRPVHRGLLVIEGAGIGNAAMRGSAQFAVEQLAQLVACRGMVGPDAVTGRQALLVAAAVADGTQVISKGEAAKPISPA